MRVTKLRAGASAVLMLFGLILGGLVTAPSASAQPVVDFTSSDFLTWDSTGNLSQIEAITGNIGSTFTVAFPIITDTCVVSIIKPTVCAIAEMEVDSSPVAVRPSSGTISTSGITTFTILGSGTLTLSPVLGLTCRGSVGCTPLTIRITAIGPKNIVSTNCTTWDASGTSNAAVSGHIGESFTVTFPNIEVTVGGVGDLSLCPNYTFSSSTAAATPGSGTIETYEPTTFTITGSGTISFTRFAPASILRLPIDLTITVTALPLDAPPPDLLQQVGAPSASTCAAVIDTTLNWAGAPSGGWVTSWAQWMNQGKGGMVCTRSLYWLPSGRWSVRA